MCRAVHSCINILRLYYFLARGAIPFLSQGREVELKVSVFIQPFICYVIVGEKYTSILLPFVEEGETCCYLLQ